MNTLNPDTPLPAKPLPLRTIFILNGIMAVLPFVFYAVFTTRNIEIDGLDPVHMLYTGAGYIVSFALLIYFILHRNITGVRVIILLNVLIALPPKAYIGMIVAAISFTLTFNQKVRAYFLVD